MHVGNISAIMTKAPYHSPFSQSLGQLALKAIGPEIAKRGFVLSELILNWREIVGEELCALSRPVKIKWPRGSNQQQGGTLMVRIERGFALEFSMQSPVFLQRLAALCGWQVVEKIQFEEGAVFDAALVKPQRGTAPSAPLGERVEKTLEEVEHERLKQALSELGGYVSGAHKGRMNKF